MNLMERCDVAVDSAAEVFDTDLDSFIDQLDWTFTETQRFAFRAAAKMAAVHAFYAGIREGREM